MNREECMLIIEQELQVLDKEMSKMISDLHNLNKTKHDLLNLLEQYRNEPQKTDFRNN